MSYERNCLMCGEEYRYCPHCSEFDRQPRWKGMFDRKECHDVFYIINDYRAGIKTKEETRNLLVKVNMKDIQFNDVVKRAINEIMEVSSDELKKSDDLINESDEIIEDVKKVEKVIAEDRRATVKIKPVSTVKPTVVKTADK